MELCKTAALTGNKTDHEMVNFHLSKNLGKDLPVVNTLDDLIKELRSVFESDSVNVEYVNFLMKSCKLSPVDWKKYAKFDRYRYEFFSKRYVIYSTFFVFEIGINLLMCAS